MKMKFKVAAVQASPILWDLNKTITKAESIVQEAAAEGAELIAFPEAFFPGYPYWIWLGEPAPYGVPFFEKLYNNAVTIPGPACSRFSEMARKNNVFLCVSVTEKDMGSLYLTQLWFDKEGNLMGKHRKLRPTGAERTVWGEGDGSMMPVFETELGRLGGLQCWEHLMPFNSVAMASQNEQIHVAAWPSFSPDNNHIFGLHSCPTITKYYAMSSGTYAILTSETISQENLDYICGDDDYKKSIYKKGYGCTQIINPSGITISEIIPHDEEGIAYAEVDLTVMPMVKYLMDPAGQYSKASVVSLNFDRRPQKPVNIIGEATDYGISYDDLHKE
jgi:predicted amidohydrolase